MSAVPMSAVPKKRRFTIQEYLALEDDSLTKHEFYHGELFAMAGASIRHNDIAGNIFARLHGELRGKGCRPYGSDQRIRIQQANLYTYSDTTVICGPIARDEDDRQAATNPRVVFEVLSKSTENYDRGKKWEFYQQLDSLREYVLVSQEEAKIERYSRDEGGQWRYSLTTGLDQSLELESLGVQLPLTEIYDNVTFGPEETAEPPADEAQSI
jgi:Uma2 family endonuclease